MREYLPALPEPTARWMRFIALLAAALLLLWFCIRMQAVLNPMLAALAAAYVVNPLINRLERERIARVYCVALLYAAAALLVALVAALLARPAVEQVGNLIAWGTQYSDRAADWLRQHTTPTSSQVGKLLEERSMALARALLSGASSLFSDTAYWMSVGVLFPMYAFYFMWRFNDLVRAIHDHLPSDWRDVIVQIATTADKATSDFFRGRLVVCAVVGVLTSIGWLIVGVPYSIGLGLLVGVLNLVPFVSIAFGLPPALLAAYLHATDQGQSWVNPVILTAGVFFVVQAIESFALAPYVLAQSSGLHPVTTVVALLIGAQIAGMFGLLIAIPAASTLKSLATAFVLPELRRLAGRAPSGVAAAGAAAGDGEPAAGEAVRSTGDAGGTPRGEGKEP